MSPDVTVTQMKPKKLSFHDGFGETCDNAADVSSVPFVPLCPPPPSDLAPPCGKQIWVVCLLPICASRLTAHPWTDRPRTLEDSWIAMPLSALGDENPLTSAGLSQQCRNRAPVAH